MWPRSVALIVLLGLTKRFTSASSECNTTSDCERVVGKGSQCIQEKGICSNRFEKGCLYSLLPEWDKLRVCNSEDPPDAVELGLCQKPEIDYMELRIGAGNWDSSLVESWLMQIVLSEILGVPSSSEGQTADSRVNFYDRTSSLVFGYVDVWEDLENAHRLTDCNKANRSPEQYEACAHFVPEMWVEDDYLTRLVKEGKIEPPEGMGLLGWQTWYIPKLTVDRDPTLISYFGLQGEDNRKKLAGRFLRPVTWGDYCRVFSSSNCTTDDGVAKRAPTEAEYSHMFAEGLYTGHFNATARNDCELNETNCTGHFADYPCGWGSYFQQQSHHLKIALESNGEEPFSGGYWHSQLAEIWRAANATRSDVMMMWWTPDRLVQEFMGTDYEFQRVTLPPATQDCVENRAWETCSDDVNVRVGDPSGSCESPPAPIYKVLSTSLLDRTDDSSEATRSPAYEALRLFRIKNTQMDRIFEKVSQGSHREAICEWVVNNLDFVQSFIPRTYPRTVQEGNTKDALSRASFGLALVATFLVLATGAFVYRKRKRDSMKFAQVEFLSLLLFGLLIISLGALVTGLSPPTDASCVTSIWLINLGYTIELVPLLVKVAAINRLVNAAQRMRRVTIPHRKLFGVVMLVSAIVSIVLLVWTILDPSEKNPEYELTDTTTEDGATIVTVNYYCSSESEIWRYVSVGWIFILLICATVLAVQARNLIEAFNESQTLAFMIFSHFFCMILRLITYALENEVSRSTLYQWESLVFSVDVIATIAIYFVPKFISPDRRQSYDTRASFSGAFTSSRFPSPNVSGANNQAPETFRTPNGSGTNDTSSGE